MIQHLRELYNQQFTDEKYQAFLKDMHNMYPGAIEFRLAETPVFVPAKFRNQMLETCESIIDLITDSSFLKHTEKSIPLHLRVQHETPNPAFMVFDFAICEQEGLEPQLIEMQGFPSLFGFQVAHDDLTRKNFDIPPDYTPYLGGYNRESYIQSFKSILLGEHLPEQVILLELYPDLQKTRVDFYCTRELTGISIVCLSDLIKEGRQLFYLNKNKKIPIRRIYNRIIFDELLQQSEEMKEKGKIMFEDLDVEWVPHPNWFYRISKYLLPFLHHPHVPETFFLNEIKQLPANLENYVLKPLFSFAGKGVIIDLCREDIENITDPENWILQRKVNYAEAIQTPEGTAKAEIRIFYFWEKGSPRPVPVNNLARLSKGKMIGVSYNKDKTWVGGSFCYFET